MKPDSYDIFDLDLNLLDRHWREQPQLVLTHGRELADAKDALERAKASLDVISAEIYLDVTNNPGNYGLAKATVDSTKAAVEQNSKVRQARKAVHDAKHTVDTLQALMNALDNRKWALENLVTLFTREYFAEPKTDRDGRNELDQRRSRSLKERVKLRK
ncbi:MAG: hypothetical protein JRG73_20095, partial [Deltaproteobacteria bacterium]|nr:hypothetical protein [Deltaproteobacteria bacterium]